MTKANSAKGYMRDKKVLDNLAGYAFLAPAMIGYILFIFGPIILSAVLSFFNYNLIQAPKFIGDGNILRLMKDSLVQRSFGNTFKFLAILVPIHCILGMILAFMVSRTRHLQGLYRTSNLFSVHCHHGFSDHRVGIHFFYRYRLSSIILSGLWARKRQMADRSDDGVCHNCAIQFLEIYRDDLFVLLYRA